MTSLQAQLEFDGPVKVCTGCGESKSVDAFSFYKDRQGEHRRLPRCRVCRTNKALAWNRAHPDQHAAHDKAHKQRTQRRRRARMYGLTEMDLLIRESSQGGHCLVCREYFGDDMHIDHDHETGYVRGLLCPLCNVGLGAFKDDPMRLVLAARYLVLSRGFAAQVD